MINLNDFQNNEKEVSIFNNGNAGKVNNVTITVKKKGKEDKENAPDYKLLFKDSFGEINEGIYYMKETDNNPGFKITRIINIMNAVNPETVGVELPQFPSYKEAVDFLMKKIHEGSSKGYKVNVFVAYGNEGYPKQYLTLRGINFIENSTKEEALSRLTPVMSSDLSKSLYNDVMVRPQADAPTKLIDDNDVFGLKSESSITTGNDIDEDFGF